MGKLGQYLNITKRNKSQTGLRFKIKTRLFQIWGPMLMIRRSRDRLIFKMGSLYSLYWNGPHTISQKGFLCKNRSTWSVELRYQRTSLVCSLLLCLFIPEPPSKSHITWKLVSVFPKWQHIKPQHIPLASGCKCKDKTHHCSQYQSKTFSNFEVPYLWLPFDFYFWISMLNPDFSIQTYYFLAECQILSGTKGKSPHQLHFPFKVYGRCHKQLIIFIINCCCNSILFILNSVAYVSRQIIPLWIAQTHHCNSSSWLYIRDVLTNKMMTLFYNSPADGLISLRESIDTYLSKVPVNDIFDIVATTRNCITTYRSGYLSLIKYRYYT